MTTWSGLKRSTSTKWMERGHSTFFTDERPPPKPPTQRSEHSVVLHAAAPNYLDKHSRPDKLKSKDNSGLQRENLSKCVDAGRALAIQ